MSSIIETLANIPVPPGYVKVIVEGVDGSVCVQFLTVASAARNEKTLPNEEGGMTAEEEAAFEKFVAENEAKEEAEAWWHAEVEKQDRELQHVAELLSAEDKMKEKAKEVFVDANRKFQIQKKLYQEKAPRAELHAAQVAYIKTVDELRAIMAEINDHTFTLRAMADERWPDENHDDFEQKLKTIYDSIKSIISRYNPNWVKHKPTAGKPAPGPSTLADMLSAKLAKEAAGGGKRKD
jgi:hypothetical protein